MHGCVCSCMQNVHGGSETSASLFVIVCVSVCVSRSKLLCWMTQSSDLDICLSVLRSVCCFWGTDLRNKECVPSFRTQLWERPAASVFHVEQGFLEAAEKHFIISSVLLVGDEGSSSCSRLCSPSISMSTHTRKCRQHHRHVGRCCRTYKQMINAP